jgi:serine/threonine-protein kinase RsbW
MARSRGDRVRVFTAEKSTVRPEIAQVHGYHGPARECLQNVVSGAEWTRGAQERMHSRVTAAEPADDARFCLVFPCEAISVPVMRRVLGDALDRLGVDSECVSDLLLAVTEACTNVLRHSGPGLRYELVAMVDRNRCVLEVVDTGRGFDPAARAGHRTGPRSVPSLRRRRSASGAPWLYPAPSRRSGRARMARVTRAEARALARVPESGRGLAIMRACVDDVTLRTRPGRGTVVSLQKRIELRSDAPLARPDVLPLRDAG